MTNETHNGQGSWQPTPFKGIRSFTWDNKEDKEEDRLEAEEREMVKRSYRPQYMRYGKKYYKL